MFLKKAHVETSNKNGLDLFHFDQLLKYEKKHVECLLNIYISLKITFHDTNSNKLDLKI